MIEIHEAKDEFDFDAWMLRYPMQMAGGNIFSKLVSRAGRNALYIQTPVCTSRSGFSGLAASPSPTAPANAAKKAFCDLVFGAQESEEFLRWMDRLVDRLQKQILAHSGGAAGSGEDAVWFQNDFTAEEIDEVFISPMKPFRGGKSFVLKTIVPQAASASSASLTPAVKIYDENECDVPASALSDPALRFLAILEVQGVKCTQKNFQIETTIKQVMVLNSQSVFDTKCLLKAVPTVPTTPFASLPAIAPSENVETTETVLDRDQHAFASLPAVDPQNLQDGEHETLDGAIAPQDTDTIANADADADADADVNTDTDANTDTDFDADAAHGSSGGATTVLEEVELDDDNDGGDGNDGHDGGHDDGDGIEVVGETDLEDISSAETVSIKRPKQIYYEMYQKALQDAALAKSRALDAYMAANSIKCKYLLEDVAEISPPFDAAIPAGGADAPLSPTDDDLCLLEVEDLEILRSDRRE